MKITGNGEMLQIARITGPTHNFLRLTFASQAQGPAHPRIVVDQPPALLQQDELCAAVLQGSDEAGGLDDLGLCIASILYVGSDTPIASTYRGLARRLIEHKRSETIRDRREDDHDRAAAFRDTPHSVHT